MTAHAAAAVTVACLCLFIAAVAPRIRFGSRKPEPPSRRKVDMFLTRMIHETCYNGTRFVSFRIDCFLFDFKPWNPDGLDESIQYDFLDYTRTLDLANQQAIVKMAIWLIQRGVRFRLKYQYNGDLPVRYNLRQVRKPKKLWYMVLSMDRQALLDYDLSKDTHALRQ